MTAYIKNNKLTLLIVFSAIIMGIVIGAGTVAGLSREEAQSLYSAVNESVKSSGVFSAFLKSLQNEFRRFGILFLCGVTVIGSPVAVFYLGCTGYALGFSVGFLIKYYGLLGFLGAFCGIVPHYLILLPAYMCAGIIGINFSNRLLLGEKNLKDSFKVYSAKMLIVAFAILAACVTEGFFSAFLLKKILGLIT